MSDWLSCCEITPWKPTTFGEWRHIVIGGYPLGAHIVLERGGVSRIGFLIRPFWGRHYHAFWIRLWGSPHLLSLFKHFRYAK